MKYFKLLLIILSGLFFSYCSDNIDEGVISESKNAENQFVIQDDFLTNENLTEDEIRFVAQTFTANNPLTESNAATRVKRSTDIKNIFPILSDGQQILAYAVNFKGGGYNIISANQKYAPIIGFAEEGSIEPDYRKKNPSFAFWLDFLEQDIICQKNKTDETDSVAINNRMLWQEYKAVAISSRNRKSLVATRATTQDHRYWYNKERDWMMSGEASFTSSFNFMSEDLQRYNDMVRKDYGNQNYLSDGEKDALRRNNVAMKANYERAGLWAPSAYYWSEYFKGYNEYNTGELVKTKWHQGYPYNIQNPLKEGAVTPDNPDKYQPAGCVTIAVSQILNYHKYPQTLRRMEGGLSVKTLNVDWNKTNIISLSNPNLTDIPQLIRFVNQGVFTINGDNSSSSNITNAKNFFELNQYTVNQYDGRFYDKMITEVKAGRPVYVRGDNGKEGHAFICNGYKNLEKRVTIELTSTNSLTVKDYSTNPYFIYKSSQGNRTATGEYFSFNWGWGGSSAWIIIPTNTPLDLQGFNNDIKILTIHKR